jgi:hypothetical protein
MRQEELEVKIRELSDYLKMEVLDYIEFLLKKYKGKKIGKRKFKFDCKKFLDNHIGNLNITDFSLHRI